MPAHGEGDRAKFDSHRRAIVLKAKLIAVTLDLPHCQKMQIHAACRALLAHQNV